MNYIRGVASAISAPYQYYKELPPINPSTLTGAIDVIVIQRPGPDGDTELACSPFHVRFGKWQVLRPGEKKVNVSVNGNPIPFAMKIGEAGEAFFVFETDEDVPPDLITSPILHPVDLEPEESVVDDSTGRFGAKPDGEDDSEQQEAKLREEEVRGSEPEYFDLDARGYSTLLHGDKVPDAPHTVTPKQDYHTPSYLKRSDSKSTINQKTYLTIPPSNVHQPSAAGERTPEMEHQDRRVDEALKVLSASDSHLPEVEYHADVALDMEGYHSGYHERVGSNGAKHLEFEHYPPPLDAVRPDDGSQPTASSSSSSASPPDGPLPYPVFRATSEPPPDVIGQASAADPSTSLPAHSSADDVSQTQSHERPAQGSTRLSIEQLYSWEWGGFPTPSPLKATFSKSGRLEGPLFNATGSVHRRTKTMQIKNGRLGGMQLPVLQDSDDEAMDDEREPMTHRGRSLAEKEHGRSHSVPAVANQSPNRKRRRREWKEYEDFDGVDDVVGGNLVPDENASEDELAKSKNDDDEFGIGGTLHVNKHDTTKFILSIEGRRVGFQISVLPDDVVPASEPEERSKDLVYRFFKSHDSVEAASVFQKGIVNYDKFLAEERIVHDARLVIRWIGVEQYVTRQDGSPLMDALIHWRQGALRHQDEGHNGRPVSPASEDEATPPSPPQIEVESAEKVAGESQLETTSGNEAVPTATPGKKPTSTSWAQWWSRGRRATDAAASSEMTVSKSTPSAAVERVEEVSPAPVVEEPKPIESLPQPQEVLPEIPLEPPVKVKKYAKTLRLTSDQLKSLNLQLGTNSITFSLSATGAVAATARIFVWEHTDQILVSDIDGTITKSDGLGHVFAMLGRDWTHLGVAKLYTDIVRNGYKIMYLTSRAIGQADATRGYLKGIKQNNYQLPEGPVIMSPDRLMAALHREVVMRKPEVFKMACLRDIQRLFGEHAKYPFYAGFGNRITDALSYRSVNIPSARIFTIDSTGEVKMELLELAGYKSSYIHMTDLVDQMFPPIHRKWAPEFTDFNYWRAPLQEFPLPDLSPPSPALSARSDTSNRSTLARIRNFSLGGARQQTIRSENGDEGERKEHQLRQMSSFERLSTTLGFMSSVNSGYASPGPDDSDDEEDDRLSESGAPRKRPRRRSITSMPGSLNDHDMDFDSDEDDEEYDDQEDQEDRPLDHEEHSEEAFDEDLLAAGEMSKVPFL